MTSLKQRCYSTDCPEDNPVHILKCAAIRSLKSERNKHRSTSHSDQVSAHSGAADKNVNASSSTCYENVQSVQKLWNKVKNALSTPRTAEPMKTKMNAKSSTNTKCMNNLAINKKCTTTNCTTRITTRITTGKQVFKTSVPKKAYTRQNTMVRQREKAAQSKINSVVTSRYSTPAKLQNAALTHRKEPGKLIVKTKNDAASDLMKIAQKLREDLSTDSSSSSTKGSAKAGNASNMLNIGNKENKLVKQARLSAACNLTSRRKKNQSIAKARPSLETSVLFNQTEIVKESTDQSIDNNTSAVTMDQEQRINKIAVTSKTIRKKSAAKCSLVSHPTPKPAQRKVTNSLLTTPSMELSKMLKSRLLTTAAQGRNQLLSRRNCLLNEQHHISKAK